MHKSKTERQLTISVLTIILLACCLAFTSIALTYSMVSVDENVFITGMVDINLNDGKHIIEDGEFLFEPGMTVKKDFFVENDSSCDVYYKLYFLNVSGDLADHLEVTIMDGEKLLYKGTPRDLNKKNTIAANDILTVGERRDLQILFHFDENAGNEAQNAFLAFDFAAEAVQVKNNTNKDFT